MIISPRQARDKHREHSKQRRVFLQGYDVPDSVWDAAPSPGGAGEHEDPDALAAGYSNPAFYSAEHSDTAFLVEKTLECVETVAGRCGKRLF